MLFKMFKIFRVSYYDDLMTTLRSTNSRLISALNQLGVKV